MAKEIYYSEDSQTQTAGWRRPAGMTLLKITLGPKGPQRADQQILRFSADHQRRCYHRKRDRTGRSVWKTWARRWLRKLRLKDQRCGR